MLLWTAGTHNTPVFDDGLSSPFVRPVLTLLNKKVICLEKNGGLCSATIVNRIIRKKTSFLGQQNATSVRTKKKWERLRQKDRRKTIYAEYAIKKLFLKKD